MISNETLLNDEYPFSLPPKTVVGYRGNGNPIYNIAGGSEDISVGSEDDDVETDDSDSDDDSDAKDTDSWTPPTREDFEKLMASKAKADSEAAARKRFLRDAGLDPKTGKPIQKPTVELEDEDDDEDSTDDSSTKDTKSKGFNKEKYVAQFERQLEREVAKAERSGRISAYALIHEVPAALEEAGWNGKNLPRMTRLLELDDLEIDSDGIDAEGLTSKIASLKNDFPEFFKRTRMKDAAKEVADSGTVGGGKKKAPASEEDQDWKTRMKNQILGG